MNKDLVDTCTMFLVPASILFAAIGIAKTEWLKALISFIGVCLGALWFYCILYWAAQPPLNQVEKVTGLGLAFTFAAAAAVSTVVHVTLGIERWPDKPTDEITVFLRRDGREGA
jgi:hypothetical protein